MTTPPARSARPGMKDIAIALGILIPIVLLVAGVARACSFSPAGPTVDTGRLPTVDAAAELRSAATQLPFEVRIPTVPADWRANSASSEPDAGAPAVRVGWLTPQGHYLRLVQGAAVESDLLIAEVGPGAVASGPVDVAGRRWVVYAGGGSPGSGSPGGEPAWVSEFAASAGAGPAVRVLITGSGTADEFRTLAAAVGSGQVLPPR